MFKTIGIIAVIVFGITFFYGIWDAIVNDKNNIKGQQQNELLWEISTLKLELQKIELQRKIKEASGEK